MGKVVVVGRDEMWWSGGALDLYGVGGAAVGATVEGCGGVSTLVFFRAQGGVVGSTLEYCQPTVG